MLFLCFSSKDRIQIVEAILFHITNYELPVWYDRHKMLMGDHRNYKNFDEGVGQSKYAVIIVSPNAIDSVCAQEEMELIFKHYSEGKIIVFPIFYNINATELPENLQWMTKLVYKELDAGTDAYSACNHIICRVLLDELEKYKMKSINDFLSLYGHNSALCYITKLLQAYCRISDDNRDAQIALLYATCLYIREYYNLNDIPAFYHVGVDRLFDETRLHLPIDLRETLIFERLTLLLINSVLFGYIP